MQSSSVNVTTNRLTYSFIIREYLLCIYYMINTDTFQKSDQKESALCGNANLCHRTTPTAWINIGNGEGCSLRVQRQSENVQEGISTSLALNPKSTGFDTMSRTTSVPSFKSL